MCNTDEVAAALGILSDIFCSSLSEQEAKLSTSFESDSDDS